MSEVDIEQLKNELESEFFSSHVDHLQRINDEVERHRLYMQSYVRNITFFLSSIITILLAAFFFLVGQSYVEFQGRLNSEVDAFIAKANNKIDDSIIELKADQAVVDKIESNVVEFLKSDQVLTELSQSIDKKISESLQPLTNEELEKLAIQILTDQKHIEDIVKKWISNRDKKLNSLELQVRSMQSSASSWRSNIDELEGKVREVERY